MRLYEFKPSDSSHNKLPGGAFTDEQFRQYLNFIVYTLGDEFFTKVVPMINFNNEDQAIYRMESFIEEELGEYLVQIDGFDVINNQRIWFIR